MSGRVRKPLLAAATVALMTLLAASGCRGLPAPLPEAQPRPVAGADDMGMCALSLSDQGAFYYGSNHLRYLDLQTGESYVLCGRPDCLHADASCVAYYERYGDARGLAMYGDRIYVLKLNRAANAYDLLAIEPSGLVERTLHSFDIGDWALGSWCLGSFDHVVYAGGQAWLTLRYERSEELDESGAQAGLQAQCLVGIDLTTGQRTDLAGLPLDPGSVYSIELASDGYVVMNRRFYAQPMLSPDEFKAAREDGGFPEYADGDFLDNPYYQYQAWFMEHTVVSYELSVYDVASKKATPFAAGECISQPYDGDKVVSLPKYVFSGAYEGALIYTVSDWSNPYVAPGHDGYDIELTDTEVFSLDPASGRAQPLFSIDRGNLVYMGYAGSVTRDGCLLFVEYVADGRSLIRRYSLEGGAIDDLYEDVPNVTHRPLGGETADSFVYRDINEWDDPLHQPVYFIISKEGFYGGDFGSARRLKL